MTGYVRRPSERNTAAVGYRLLFLCAVLLAAAGLAAYVLFFLAVRNPSLNAAPVGLFLGIPCGIALLCASAYCFMGLCRARPWMQRHFRGLWWIIFDDTDFAPASVVDAESSQAALGRVMDQIGDVVKNAIMDFGVADPAGQRGELPEFLPQMQRSEFIAALRPRVDELLARMADEINSVPPDHALEMGKERVHLLLGELEDELLVQGLSLRIKAAQARQPKDRRPQGEWATRYRMMVLAGGDH